jgi:hypothetical protein
LFEPHLAPFPEPTDYLRSRSEPAIQRSQRLQEVDVKVAPKALRPMASVMPEKREHTAEVAGSVN